MKNLFVILSFILITSCISSRVEYIEAKTEQILTTDFSSSDLQKIVAKMVDSLFYSSQIKRIISHRRPVISVSKIRNKTMQHIDTESITDSIKTRLIKSGKFQFVNRKTDQAAIKELKYQRDSGMVKQSTAQPFGEQIGVEYLLTGSFSEIIQEAGRKKDVYYKITLNLKNIRTGIDEWAEEKEIRKLRTKPVLGW